MPSSLVTNGRLCADDEKKPIKVYARVRPFNDEEIERGDSVSVETFDDEKRIKVIDEKHSQETTYHFDGVFSGTDSNEKVFVHTTQHLLTKLLNGINCALLTYGQTGSGKTFTLMADGCITEYAVQELFDKIEADKLHKYKITCSFVQVYLEKVYDLLSHDSKELPVREHPKQGIYVSNLTHHQANSQEEVLALFDKGRQELVTAETKMVRHSSRSHSIFQLSIERRLDIQRNRHIAPAISAYGNMKSENDIGIMVLEEDMVLRAKMDICDLAGSERLGKTMVEGVHLSEAKHINSSLLELGNVIYALSEGKRRHIPFRNSTLTRLLQECLGSRCQTSFIVCVAPSSGEAYETRCSLNFGTRARTITNKERMCLNVEFDYKLLAKKLTKRVELLELELQSARPIRDFISSSLNGLNIATETQTDFSGNTSETSSGTEPSILIKHAEHALDIYGMLELLMENNENLHQHSSNYDTLRSTSAMALFTMAISSIANTQDLLMSGKGRNHLEPYDFASIMEESLQKMTKIKSEIVHIKRADKNDLFNESAYMISEVCTDIENILEKVVAEIERSDMSKDGDNSLYKKVSNALQLTTKKHSGKEKIVSIVHSLLNILQVFQITRILLESSRWYSTVPDLRHKKSLITSSFIEEETWDADNTFSLSSNEDAYFSDFSSMAESARFEQIKINQLKKEKDFLKKQSEEKQSVFSPLGRSHSFKTKKEMWRSSSSTHFIEMLTDYESNCELSQDRHDEPIDNTLLPVRLIRRRSKFSSVDYPLTLTKQYAILGNGNAQGSISDGTEVDNYLNKSEFGELEKRYNSLANKYKNVTSENVCLTEKLSKAQNDKMTLMSERDYARRQISTFLETKNEVRSIAKNDDCDKGKGVDQITHNQEEVSFLETKLKEQENVIKKLEEDIIVLTEEREVLKEKNNSNVQLLEKYLETEKVEEKVKVEEDKKAFATDILTVCNWLDLVCDQKSQRRTPGSAEDISSLEHELFKITEHLVKYEAAVKEIRIRSNRAVLNEDGGQKIEESIEEPIKILHQNVTSNKVNSQSIPAHITKKINFIKKEHKKLVNNVRASYVDQPISSVKEIKLCRASRVKELIQDKLQMAETISSLEQQVSQKETQIKEQKKQIDLLIQELAKLDGDESRIKCDKVSREESGNVAVHRDKKQKSFEITIALGEDEDIEIINIPEIKYNDLVKLASIINNKESTIENSSFNSNDLNNGNEMVPIQIVEQLKEELDACKKEKLNIIAKYESGHMLQENNSLQRKVQVLTESNCALLDENQILKATCQKNKVHLKELREKNNALTSEFEKVKRNNLTAQARSDNLRHKLDRKLVKMKGKVARLEKYSKNLEENVHLLKKEKSCNQTFNDSGLVQDDAHYIFDT